MALPSTGLRGTRTLPTAQQIPVACTGRWVAAGAEAVSAFFAFIRSPCLRQCVHGASTGGGGGYGDSLFAQSPHPSAYPLGPQQQQQQQQQPPQQQQYNNNQQDGRGYHMGGGY
jgi:hypothetical protein